MPEIRSIVRWGGVYRTIFFVCLLRKFSQRKLRPEIDPIPLITLLIPLFIHSGRTGELLTYWEYLRASVAEMAAQYREALVRSEEGAHTFVYFVYLRC